MVGGEWPQRAEAMKSRDGHFSSSGKLQCTTAHSTQPKARIEEALSRNVQTVPVRLEEKLDGVSRATRLSMHRKSWCRRFCADSEQFQVKQRQARVHTVNADVPLGSVLGLFAVRCLLFRFCGAALAQTPCDSGVACASICICGP